MAGAAEAALGKSENLRRPNREHEHAPDLVVKPVVIDAVPPASVSPSCTRFVYEYRSISGSGWGAAPLGR